MLIIVLLILLGIGLLLVEILVVTGSIVTGVIGFALMVAGVYLSYDNHGIQTGNYVLLSTALAFVIIMYYALRASTWARVSLKTNIDSKVNVLNTKIRVGTAGQSVTRMAPIGKILIDKQTYEARSINEYIDAHRPIEVVSITGNQIIVKLKKE